MKKIISLLLVVVTVFALCVPALAAETANVESVPSWVQEGETWFPAGGIALCEDEGLCPKAHTAPEGYTYQGYAMGYTSDYYDMVSCILRIVSIFSSNEIIVKGAALTAELIDWLGSRGDERIEYFRYVYSKPGSPTYVHVIYAFKDGYYHYVECEAYYDVMV